MKQVNKTNLNSATYWDDVYLSERGSGKRRVDDERINYVVGQMRSWKDHNPHEENNWLLDVGCGDGEMLRFLHAHSPTWKMHGIDITPNTLNSARSDNPGFQFKDGSIYEIPYEANTFNVIFCGETIEHLEHPQIAIAELFRVAKPGGYVIISLPNEHANYSPEHINEFTVGECLSLTSKYGQVIYDDIRVVCNGISVVWVTKNG
ncbi:MAG: class I SAM-dependent methyltransferase [Candidatus Berkelbacteria bacterium]|nr:class I SAM-dependent methyltransferase [Candidatus Berkelbacteria bacterium]